METLTFERSKGAKQVQTTEETDNIDEMLSLITHMHQRLTSLKKSQSCKIHNVKLINSMMPEKLYQSCRFRCRESEEDREYSYTPHSQQHMQTFAQENLNLHDGNHLPFPSVDFSCAMPKNGKRLDSGRLTNRRSEDFHNLKKKNVDTIGEHLVSPSRGPTDVIFSEKSQIHDIALSNPDSSLNLTQIISGDTTDTSTVLSVGLTALSMDPPAVVIATIPRVESEVPLKFSAERPHSDVIWKESQKNFLPEIVSASVIDPRSDLEDTEAEVQKLVEDLKSNSLETLRAAIAELRFLARLNTENRIMIAECGAISFLVKLLYSTDAIIQEQAVTTLLNLSIHEDCKIAIGQSNAIEPLIHVLKTGSPEAKENSAATLYSLLMIDDNKVKIGRSGAIGPLVELLGNGTPRGKKDAATALFYLSLLSENKVKIVKAGAVKHLVDLMDPSLGMVDKAVAVLANVAAIPEGRVAIGRDGGIPVLVEAVELGSARGKENAAAALLRLCSNASKYCIMALQEGLIPPLVALTKSGTPRAKEKAHKLMDCFRNHLHGVVEKG